MHAFLFLAAQPRGEDINYAQLQAAETRDLAMMWVSEFRDLQRRATAALDRDSEFFRECAYIGPRLYSAVSDSVKPAALGSPLNISHNLYHHLVVWAANKHRIEAGASAHAGDAFELNAGVVEIYDAAWRSFIAPWEFYLSAIFERVDDRPDWAALTLRAHRLLDHLRRTVEMAGRSAWMGDKAATRWSCDMLLKWEHIGERGWSDGKHAWSLKSESLTADILSEDWAMVREKPLSHFGEEIAPQIVFGRVVKNALLDHIVALASILVHWALQFGAKGAAALGARMLLRDEPYDEGSSDYRDLGAVSAEAGLLCFVRVAGARVHYSKGYSASFDDLAESLGRLSEAPYVSMRIYSSNGGGLGFSALYLEHVLVLMAGVRRAKPALSEDLRRVLLDGDDEARRGRLDYLEPLRRAVDKVDAAAHAELIELIGDRSGAIEFAERQSHVRELVDLAIALLRNARLEAMRAAPIDPERLAAVARAASASGFSKETGEFPLPLFAELSLIDQPLERWTLNVQNRERGEYTTPLMAVTSGDDWLKSAVAETVGARVFADIIKRMTFERLDGGAPEPFWEAIKRGAGEIEARGGRAILIVSNTFEPRWLNDWRWRNGAPKPDDLRVHQEDIHEDGYQFSLNDVRVYQARTPKGLAYLIPRNAFARASFHDFGDGCAVQARFEDLEGDPWHGTLKLEYQREVALGETEGFEVRHLVEDAEV